MVRVPRQVVFTLLAGVVAGVRVEQDLSASLNFSLGDPIHGEFGAYDLAKEELGRGAYGRVHLATEQSTGQELVAKIIDLQASPEAQKSFSTEGTVWAYMRGCHGYPHPNVIQYHEVLQLNARYGVVIMEKAAGGSLSSLLYRGVSADSTLSGTRTGTGDDMIVKEDEAKKLFGQIAAGAQWLATCGVIHKDLKPDNIMLSKAWTAGGVAKIIDFGLAAVLEYKESGALANMYYNLVQSVDIASLPLAAKTFDDFALGLILAEIGTGVPPFFNPDFDYYSNKGNLRNEKGILYIKATLTECRQGQPKLFLRMKALADLSIKDLRSVIGEVVGRSLHVNKKQGAHFLYTSAAEAGIDLKWAEGSWLYNSPSALELLHGLLQRDATQRIDPAQLLSSYWLSGAAQTAASYEPVMPKFKPNTDSYGGFESPGRGDFTGFTGGFGSQGKGDFSAGSSVVKPRDVDAVDSSKPLCQNPRKERGPLSLCKIRFTSSSPSCFVKVSCNGGKAELREVFSGFGGNEVERCPSCQLL